jgi:diacylglycerol kinase (ATP)
MALAPAGRCNDLARALGVNSDPAQIAEIVAGGHTQPIDLGRINGRYFCTVATVGIDAEVSSFVDTSWVPLRGTAAYLFGAMWVLSRYRAPGVRLEGDFGVIERPVFVASSANTSSYGGAIEIAPGAVPTDGELDLCVIDAVSRPRALALVASVLRGRHLNEREVQFIRTKRIRIEAERELTLWADGERVATTPSIIEVMPAALHVALPPC